MSYDENKLDTLSTIHHNTVVMIPLTLELTNFLSYRQTAVLVFEDLHLACIAGLNGAGKSSILDGITWALFGRSRSKSDDDLINRIAAIEGGAAEVRFTFALEESVYRVIRRKKSRKSTVLELQIEVEDKRWKSLSESKLRETQAAIEQLLHMSYDTFTNASFLLQGQADEFTTKTPNKRKEILSDLLGVSEWERYRERAVAERKQAEARSALLEGQLQDIEDELAEAPARTEAVDMAQAALDQISEKRQLKEQILQQLRQEEVAMKQQKERVAQLAEMVTRAQTSLDKLQRNQQQRQVEAAQYEAVVAEAATIEAAWQQWQAVSEAHKVWQVKADKYHRYQAEKQQHTLAIAKTRSRLETEQQTLMRQATAAKTAVSQQESLTSQLKIEKEQLATIEATLVTLAEQEKAWQKAREHVQALQAERQLWRQEQAQLQQQAKRIETVAKEKTAVAQNLAAAQLALATANEELAQMNQRHQRHAIALADVDSLQGDQVRLKEQMNKFRQRIDQLKAEGGGACPLCGQPLTAEHRQAVMAELEADGLTLGDRFRANKQRIAELKDETTALDKTLKQRERWQRDQQTQQQRQAKAEARLAEIEQIMAEWHTGPQKRLADVTALLADESALQTQQKEVDQLKMGVQRKTELDKERQQLQQAIANKEAQLAEMARLITVWQAEGEGALSGVQQQLADNDYEVAAHTAVAELDAQIEALAYDEMAHQEIEAQLTALADVPQRHQALGQAVAALRPLQDTLTDLAQQIDEQSQTVTDVMTQHQTAVVQLEALSGSRDDLRSVEDEVFALREQEHEANRRVGAAQQRLAVLSDLKQQQRQYQSQQKELSQLIQRWQLLEKACSRDGVQALLIEQALPEIEDRANVLLDRLTDGEMRVIFETQRQLKSRKATVETLDIRIVDGAGERPYENFSGGEQFRVNFAVRLALSQLLAKRSGARLQMLVIDEGFGSQDVNGRQRLVEAINTIQDDFARILVITHVDELRDAFPRRIQVIKGSTGSTIEVI